MGSLSYQAGSIVTDLPVVGHSQALLEGQHLSKRYGATHALTDVSIRLELGSVTALAGGNGAGKSTLIRLLTGVEQSDGGVILRDGAPVALNNPRDAPSAGIFTVYQDQPFIGQFEVYRQIYVGYEQHFQRFGVINDGRMRAACADLLHDLGLTSSLSPSQRMSDLSPAARALAALAGVIAVSRLLKVEHPVILLDEPTSALSAEELEFLIDFIQSLKERSALLFVSHRVTEVLEWAEVLYVLRDGRNADYMTRDTMHPDRVYEAMGGAHVEGTGASRKIFGAPTNNSPQATVAERAPTVVSTPDASRVRLSVERAHLREDAPVFDLKVIEGEIVGVAGVEGSGKEEFLRLCAGISNESAQQSAAIHVDGKAQRRRLKDLMRAGVVYLSGDRQRDGIFRVLSVMENFAVSRRAVSRTSQFIIHWGADRARASAMVSKLAVKTANVDTPLQALSGGNQQKVLLGRCLELSPRVLLLDNVTRGVDVGAKDSIYQVLRSLARDGASIVLAGDDLDELINVSDRILVFKGGAMVREFSNERRDLESLELLAAMV